VILMLKTITNMAEPQFPELEDELVIQLLSRHPYARNTKPVNLPELPPRPGIFQVDPPVTSTDQRFARLAHKYLDLLPQVKERVLSISRGPNNAAIDALKGLGYTPEEFNAADLQGAVYPRHPDIYIAPNLHPDLEHSTLLHEFSHVMGRKEDDASKVSERVLNIISKQLKKEGK
jgi:hypothetical protein